jgi:MSHA biogenesis protein MshP
MSVHTARRERGFALIGALFLLVVLAALGAFAVRISMTQRHASTLELQELRAQAALQAGIEYAAARLTPGGLCNRVQNIPAANLNLPGNFTVTFINCVRQGYNGNTVFVYTFQEIVATSGVYGTPEYVRRSARNVRITS